ncbi:MinD/ParA family protein [Nodosilinea sp. E11]|uniref:MinD/ParA family ATP-binding protein n=1 Tax=Nodosilinea sp. E11 TaxID=3037479 RepID=UPI0029344ED7|nr:MinD/ParA family protein [Nodosilinea sp. E11]WOD37061.1 MinD/ParA family protein [Nodosilinea sp. E11]
MPKIISVHSYRGGTGKSNTASNLAVILAQQGNRVAVIDTDIQSPGIHVLFGFRKDNINSSLNDYLWGKINIEDAVYNVSDRLLESNKKAGSLFLIPSSIKMGDIARVLREGYDVDRLNDGYRKLIKDFQLDYLIIDTHPGLNEETLLSITVSNILCIILRPDQQDYQGTAVTVDIARKLNVEKLFLVVNKTPEIFDFHDLKKKIEAIYDAPVAGIIPHSDDMMILGSSSIFALSNPSHPITKILEEIVHNIIC